MAPPPKLLVDLPLEVCDRTNVVVASFDVIFEACVTASIAAQKNKTTG